MNAGALGPILRFRVNGKVIKHVKGEKHLCFWEGMGSAGAGELLKEEKRKRGHLFDHV